MIDEHLTRDLFRSIHKGWRNPGDLAAIAMAHLFELCPRCRQEFEAWRRELGEGVAAPEGQDFEAVFDRVRAVAGANDGSSDALDAKLDAERKRARSCAAELLALPPEQRLEWIKTERGKLAGLLVAEVLIEECRRKTPGYPREGYALANLARIVLHHAPISAYALELYVRALARVANAVRVIGDLPRADQILSDARYFLRSQGGGDRLVRVELDSLEASLRTGQYRTAEAIPLLLRALMVHRMDGEGSEAEFVCLIKLARAHWRQGDLERALELSREASRHPGARSNPRLATIGRMARAGYLADLGRLEEALEGLDETRLRFLRLDDPLQGLRCSWTKAKILYGMARRHAAEDLMLRVRASFAAQELRYDQAQASMELATWYAAQGRRQEALPLVEEAVPVFQSLELAEKTATARALRVRLATSR